jgi:hypothetical protein
MKWKLKKSSSKSAKSPCVIKLEKNNLTGAFMPLTNLGNNEHSFSPSEIGIYRVMHNSDRSQKPIKGCYLVYQIDGEDYLRYLSISDDEVRKLTNDEIQSKETIISLAVGKRATYEN